MNISSGRITINYKCVKSILLLRNMRSYVYEYEKPNKVIASIMPYNELFYKFLIIHFNNYI